MSKISVVINTLDEEENLPRALISVKGFADEVVVCDMQSDDKTVAIAQKTGAKVYKHQRTGYVEPARNFAIGKAKGNWIFILDADEELPDSLAKKLKKIASGDFYPVGSYQKSDGIQLADYYRIPRKNIIFGKWIKHSGWWPDYNIRFFKRGYVSWSEIIHSVPETTGTGADIEADEGNAVIHYHYSSIEQYIDRLNRYTSIQAKHVIKEGYTFKAGDLMKKPVNEFLSRYFQSEGYKDGIHGLALAGLQTFSEFVKYLKVWQTGKFKEQNVKIEGVIKDMKEAESNVRYWQADTLVKVQGGIKNRLKRKFRL